MTVWTELFEYTPTSPSFLRNKINRPPKAVAGSCAGYQREDGYWLVGHENSNVLVHRIVYEIFNGPIPDGMQVDHLDGNPSNNCKENLRLVPAKVNQRNMRLSKANTSGLTGVARIVVKGRKREFVYWVAHWKMLEGKAQHANYSVSKLGEDEAKRLAVERRKLEIENLNRGGAGYSERHGKC